MRVTVIVPTYNGAEKISNILTALLRQNQSIFEIIVVIDGSTDQTLPNLIQNQTQFNNLKIIKQPNKGRSAARNRGVKESSGNLLLFFDDDMEPHPDSIQRHVLFHQTYSGLLSGNQIEEVNKGKTDIQNYKAVLTKKWTKKFTDGINELNQNNLFFTAANCSIKRIDFDALHGFDERLTDAEDFDLATRALQSGMKVFFDKSNRAIHHDNVTCRSYIHRQRQYFKANEKLFERYPERRKLIQEPGKWKHCLYRLFAISFLPKLIDEYNIFKIIPTGIRYRLYSIIIHALSREYPNTEVK